MEQRIGLYMPPPEGNGSLTSSKVKTSISRPCFNMTEIQELVKPYGGIDEGVIKDYVSNPDNNEEILRMLDRTVPTSFQKAMLLSQMGGERVQELGLDVPIDEDTDFRISIFSPQWNLCFASEMRLANSIENTMVTAVGAGLLVKFEGRLTALCYETFATRDSTFYKGNWYSPVSKDLREGLIEAHDSGVMRPHLDEGDWLLIRGRDSRYRSLVADSKYAAQNMPDDLPRLIEGQYRKSFRIGLEESESGDIDNLATF